VAVVANLSLSIESLIFSKILREKMFFENQIGIDLTHPIPQTRQDGEKK